MIRTMRNLAATILSLLALAGCTTNPVTGERKLTLVSAGQELAIGAAQYAPSRQMQGGDYVLDPALTDYVEEVGQKLVAASRAVAVVDRELPYEFTVLNNSVPNAWALPGGKIALNRGLLIEMNSEAELAAVLGHEIVHAAARHGAQQMSKGMLLQGAVLGTAIAARDQDYGNLIVGGANVGAQLIMQKYGRDAEREADRYGMLYMSGAGYDPQGAVDLQESFVRLSEGRRTDWLSGLFASHPPSPERVALNKEYLSELPAGGVRGEQEYKQRMAGLLRSKPAYDAYDEGRKALGENRPQEALALAEKAIAIEPREGHFYALQGDALLEQRRYQDARSRFSAAIERNPQFFYYPLQRGLTSLRLNDRQNARVDLEASVALLPTAMAYHGLGVINEGAGNLDLARQYYKNAAGSQSEVGQQAYRSLLRLDLPNNPGEYLQMRTGLDNKGYLLVEIANPTPATVGNLVLAVRFADANGRVQQVNRKLRGRVGPQQRGQFSTGLGPFSGPQAYQTALVSAAVAE